MAERSGITPQPYLNVVFKSHVGETPLSYRKRMAHVSDYTGVPGPRINHFREMTRFYLHWLADQPTGIMDEPPITIYVQKYDPPRMDRPETSGYWRFETEWPLRHGREQTLHLGDREASGRIVLRHCPAYIRRSLESRSIR